ncbi:hypothetical protein [Mangrovibacterium lignilyticum]|uniref:hypothetical protein n=1 Tax=Mangrovibacterium lignilyticum TaxID=2668052 RepID=UPI0013D8785C|nr:hypothetical protein [Mangrovibacterium lignilyticum]
MKTTYLIIFFVVGSIGLASGIYVKYFKNYQFDIRIGQADDAGLSIPGHLRLGEQIDFLAKLDRTFSSLGIERVAGDRLPEALTKLKTINAVAITIMVLSAILMVWMARQCYRRSCSPKLKSIRF